MTIDIFTATGTKKGTATLPKELFEANVNHALIHQAIVLQQSNRRNSIAHAKNRHEVSGSTRKLFGQKHTGKARRGSIRSPLLRGGGKAFGPRKEANFTKDMPRSMRRAALCATLSFQAKKGSIMGLESYPDTIKTKAFTELLKKMNLAESRKVLVVLPEKHKGLTLSSRNLSAVKTILVGYLNPEDVAGSRAIVFVGDSIDRALSIFGKKTVRDQKAKIKDTEATAGAEVKKAAPKKKTTKTTAKKTTKKAAASDSSK